MRYKKEFFIFILSLIFLSGCATYLPEFKYAESYFITGDYKKAYEYYKKAILKDPLNEKYRIGLIKAKTALLSSYIKAAQILEDEGKINEAIELYKKAYELSPDEMPFLAKKIENLKLSKLKTKYKVKKAIPKKIEKKEKITVNFKSAPLKQIFTAIANAGGYSVVFDIDFKDKDYSVNLKDIYWEDAFSMIAFATKNIYRKTSKGVILVAPDNFSTKKRYREEIAKTIFLKNANAKDIAKIATGLQPGKARIKALENINAIIIYGESSSVKHLAEFIKTIDKPKDQVIIEINIMEVNKRRLKDLGIDYFGVSDSINFQLTPDTENDSTTSPGIPLNSLKSLSSSDITVVIPPAMLKVLERNGDTKVLANPRIVGVQGEKIVFKIGEKFPFPNSQWNPYSPGGVPTTPVTSYDYKDVGLNFELTPEIHGNNEVTIKTKIQISALGSTGYANIPSIKNREIELYLRMKNGETHMLAGLLQEEEKKTLSGIMGLSKLPLIGSLFGSKSAELSQTDIIFTITPYIIKRNSSKSEEEVNFSEYLSSTSPIIESPEEILINPRIGRKIPLREKKTNDNSNNDDNKSKNTINFPDVIYGVQNSSFNINFNGNFSKKLKNLTAKFSFDSNLFEISSINSPHKLFKHIDNSGGNIIIGITLNRATSGNINLFTINVKFKKRGDTELSIDEITANDSSLKSIDLDYKGSIKIKIQ